MRKPNSTNSPLPFLDEVVLQALEFFSSQNLPSIHFDLFSFPLVLGSGNAEVVGRILFSQRKAIFANLNNASQMLENIPEIDGVVLVSASGSKDAPLLAKLAKKHKKKVLFLTNNPKALVLEHLDKEDKVVIFPSLPEPYSYNVSTYLGQLLSFTKEDPLDIKRHILSLSVSQENFEGICQYVFVLPSRFWEMCRMFHIKFAELFGREVARDIETQESIKHGFTIVESEKELFVYLGAKEQWWGKQQLFIPVPENFSFAGMMALGYFVIGKIQRALPPFFKENISNYTQKSKAWFKE